MTEENSSQRLKQRVVGAVVLVSLAVIFVPMLLDGDGTGPGADGPTIPPKPGYRFETLEIPLEVPGAPAAVAEPAPEPTAKPAPKPVAAVAPPPKPKPAPPPPVSSPKPPAAAPAAKGDWVVQVGSFSRQANAEGLRDRLKEAGYPAYSETITADGKSVYRVRIGPYGGKAEAEKQLVPVASKFGLKPIVLGNR